ncbi:MAG: YHYH protein [Gemmatimonadales bacterium]|nr:YHYH protein [Gemmatimonadales bacterium]
MPREIALALTLALMGVGPPAVFAHDGHEHEAPNAPHLARNVRTWTDAIGSFHVHGTFVAARGEIVQIRKEDGVLIDLKLEALSPADRDWIHARQEAIRRLNEREPLVLASVVTPPGQNARAADRPEIAEAFLPFEESLELRWDDRYLYVGSNGMPDHPMMVGITAWQQQVPLPQEYTDANAWRIPLHPVPAARPMSARENFFRGAIALAVNGVPIFNPIKNDGRTDTFLAGELDKYGGHCGRADDYHYHIAPVHLEPKTGKGKPLALALDGYPIYGYDEPDGSKVRDLDRFNGHEDDRGSYHYHATKTYPYLNGGFHGEVTERGGQVDPQPRAEGVRPALPPLRGARITGFEPTSPGAYRLTYAMPDGDHRVEYAIGRDGSVRFDFVAPDGESRAETYRARPEGLQGRPPREGQGRRPPDEQPPGSPRAEGDRPAPRGPDPNDPNRRPWIQVHAAEMDADKDGTLTRAELASEAEKTFAAYDRDGDGSLTREEYEQGPGVRSALGGFVRQHSAEIDADGDSSITRAELDATTGRMFGRADRDGDGTLAREELSAPAPPQEQPAPRDGRGRPRSGGGPPAGDRPRGGNQPQGEARPRGGGRPQAGNRPPGNDLPARKGAGAGGSNQRQTDPSEPPPFHTEVPVHPYDIVLGRPTDHSVTISLVCYDDAEAFFSYGKAPADLDSRTDTVGLKAGKPVEILVGGLEPDTPYHYRLHRKPAGADAFAAEEPSTFHTQRDPGSAYTFTIQADSHLDLGTRPGLYLQTLANARADRPDFHFELGDTFMTDKFARHTDAISQYRAQRYYLGQLCHAAPLFFVLGNHDGESGTRRGLSGEGMSTWSANTRKEFLPNPSPDGFYTGNEAEVPVVGRLEDYYAWEWGDALFIVLDPFWPTTERRPKGDDRWHWTLGDAQYRWLEQTLERSRTPFKFVFIHHLVGGATPEARGGAEAAAYFEWGGNDLDGTRTFDEHRPGWGRAIHQLLVDAGVSVVFHGHDHFFAKQEKDGIVYQLVPQPGNPRYGTPRDAADYSYREGELLNGAGHLRVRVAPDGAAVDYVLSVLPEDERDDRRNGQVAATYTITPRTDHGTGKPRDSAGEKPR